MLKKDEMTNPNSCLNKAAPDEPVFVLRANDPLAAGVVQAWRLRAIKRGLHEPAKIEEAFKLIEEMNVWRKARKAKPTQSAKPAKSARDFELMDKITCSDKNSHAFGRTLFIFQIDRFVSDVRAREVSERFFGREIFSFGVYALSRDQIRHAD